MIPLTVPEVRRLILAMAGPHEERVFRLGWSLWRRVHQAVAKRCHAAKRALLRPRPPGGGRLTPAIALTTPLETMPGRLTDAQWARIEALLPLNGGRAGTTAR